MYPNPTGNTDLTDSIVNGLLVFCIRNGLPMEEERRFLIRVALHSGSPYDDLEWPKDKKEGRSRYKIKITSYSSKKGVFKVIEDGVENGSLNRELTEQIEKELSLTRRA